MTRADIIAAQTVIRKKLDNLHNRELELHNISNHRNWSDSEIHELDSIMNAKKDLNAQFKELASRRVAH